MSRKGSRRPYAPPAKPTPEPDTYRILRGGLVVKLYGSMADGDRRAVVDAIGLKHCQRIGHRHKLADLRALTDLDTGWTAVDGWVRDAQAPGGPLAIGDLFGPLVRDLVEDARGLLGDNADEPTAQHMREMAGTLADRRGAALARVLLAAVVELEFTAAPEAREVAAGDARFELPAAG